MASPQVADEQPSMWKAATNISNKKSRTADKGWSYNFGGWARCCQLLTIKTGLLQNINTFHGPEMIIWYDLSNKKGSDFVHAILGVCIGQVHLQQQPGN